MNESKNSVCSKKADHFEFLIKLQWNGALTENDVSLIITSVLSKNYSELG